MKNLESLILAASEVLDPNHQGVHWPDPIGWDGRPLDEQARDLCALLDARANAACDRGDDETAAKLSSLSARLWDAAQAATHG